MTFFDIIILVLEREENNEKETYSITFADADLRRLRQHDSVRIERSQQRDDQHDVDDQHDLDDQHDFNDQRDDV